MKKVLLPVALTAENGAKALLIGEFHETIHPACPECDADDLLCDCCGGRGFLTEEIPVTWTTIKKIYTTIVEHYAET